ncbi:MAG: GntR family transcriptional regulator [Lachnospira sp.]
MKGELKMDVNEYLPLRDVVFNTLRQAILRGEMEPGERLMEIQLAQKLGVSRTPIREAIRKLELEGLVVMIPRKGAEVAHITEKDMKDVLEVRCALEELAATLAVKNVTSERISELKAANKVFETAIVSKDVVNIVDADVSFHDIIYAMTNNQRLVQIINNLREQMYRYRLEYVKDARTHSILISEHNDIIKRLDERNVEDVKAVVRQHINNQEKGIKRLLNK